MLINTTVSWLFALPLITASAIPAGLSNPAAVLDSSSLKPTGNYTNECSGITIDNHQILHGWCSGGSHGNEGNPNASLNLNLCVGYDHWSKALSWSPK